MYANDNVAKWRAIEAQQQEQGGGGDIVEIDKVEAKVGDSVSLTPLLLVDGETVTAAAEKLAKVTVSAEVLAATKGPKIHILKYKNKTGYKKRQGHRQKYTQVKVTGIES